MKKKLGPLKLWQWLALGAAIGVGYYIYKVHQQNQADAQKQQQGDTGSPAAGQYNARIYQPVDPTTGLPYATGNFAEAQIRRLEQQLAKLQKELAKLRKPPKRRDHHHHRRDHHHRGGGGGRVADLTGHHPPGHPHRGATVGRHR